MEIEKRYNDMHRDTASLMYGVEENKVTPEMRRVAKIFNFGAMYGMSNKTFIKKYLRKE